MVISDQSLELIHHSEHAQGEAKNRKQIKIGRAEKFPQHTFMLVCIFEIVNVNNEVVIKSSATFVMRSAVALATSASSIGVRVKLFLPHPTGPPQKSQTPHSAKPVRLK